MADFFSACGSFVSLIAQFFDLRIPYVGISFFQLFAALLIVRVVLAAIRIIFGTDHAGDDA